MAIVGVANPSWLGLRRRAEALALGALSVALAGAAWGITVPVEPRHFEPLAADREPEPETEPEVDERPSMARVWAQSVTASLDMHSERFFMQMPDDLTNTQWSRSPSGSLIHTMTWPDGSEVVTYWYTPENQPGTGLRLNHIERIGFPPTR